MTNVTKMVMNTESTSASSKNPTANAQTPKDKTSGFDKMMNDRLDQEQAETPKDVKPDVDTKEKQPEENVTYLPVVFQWMTTMADANAHPVAEMQNVQLTDGVQDASTVKEAVATATDEVLNVQTATASLMELDETSKLSNVDGQAAEVPGQDAQQKPGVKIETESTVKADAGTGIEAGMKSQVEVQAGVVTEGLKSESVISEQMPSTSDKSADADTEGQKQPKAESNNQNAIILDDRVQTPTVSKAAVSESQTSASEYMNRTEYMEQLGNKMAKEINSGKQEFEIQLEPLHLGKMLVKVTYEAGKAAVSIICSEAKTMQAISQNAKEIGSILENHMGTQTQIVVDKGQASDYLEQGHQQEKEQQQQGEQKEQNKEADGDGTDTLNFLQQLRLGLV